MDSTKKKQAKNSKGSLGSQLQKARTRQKSYVMDLRIHSPSSLGYLGIEGIDTAPALVRLAKVKGLDMIAVTDINSVGFIDKVADAAVDSKVNVIPGVVIRCAIENCDDVTLSCLFPEEHRSSELEYFLNDLNIPASEIGNQSYMVSLPLTEILEIVDRHQGIAIPSRMDKTPQRMRAISTLVNEYGFRAFDLAYADSVERFKQEWPKRKFQLFSFSNASALAQVGSRNSKVKLQSPTFSGLKEIAGREAAQ